MSVTGQTKRILYVITKATQGGAQRYVYLLATAMHASGHDVAVAYGTPGALVDQLATQGIRTIPLPGLERDIKAKSELQAFFGLVQVFEQERPDIVHLNSSKAGAMGALAAYLVHVPEIIFTAHAWAFNEKRPWWQRMVLRVMHGVTIMLSTTTICISEALKRDMAWVPGDKLVVIRNGIVRPTFKTRTEARTALVPHTTRTFWLGILAELHPTKRVRDAIEAMPIVIAEHPEALLVVLGEGEERPMLEALIENLRLKEHVVLLGFIPNGADYLTAFDLFVLPSRTEALSYALIEAGHAELPTVATNVGGIPEVIVHKRTGLLVARENPAALARALLMFMNDPEKAAQLGRELKTHVETYFAQERMIEETERVYGVASAPIETL